MKLPYNNRLKNSKQIQVLNVTQSIIWIHVLILYKTETFPTACFTFKKKKIPPAHFPKKSRPRNKKSNQHGLMKGNYEFSIANKLVWWYCRVSLRFIKMLRLDLLLVDWHNTTHLFGNGKKRVVSPSELFSKLLRDGDFFCSVKLYIGGNFEVWWLSQFAS